MPHRPRMIAGNWKMNGTAAALSEITAMAAAARSLPPGVVVAVCPPATLIDRARNAAGTGPLIIGAQDAHAEAAGAFTGSVSVEMLADAGARLVIVGHSERRDGCYERDDHVRAKAEAVVAAGLIALVCVGETAAERDADLTLDVVGRQLDGSLPGSAARLVLAYEPVWAIGTGRTPTADEVAVVHEFIRARLVARYGAAADPVPILYGGSVRPANAAALLAIPEVGGALVGGASLSAAEFLTIVAAAVSCTSHAIEPAHQSG